LPVPHPVLEFGLAFAWYTAVALGVTVGYHRVLTHRAARLSRPVLRLLVWAGLPAGPPAEWVGNHRLHHQASESDDDPHCPTRTGFWYAHAGWYLGLRNTPLTVAYAFSGPLRLLIDAARKPMFPGGHTTRAPDVTNDPWLLWLSTRRGFALGALPHLLPVAWATWAHGVLGLGAAWLLSIVMYNTGDLVNSTLHLWGRRDFSVRDASRNSGWLALPTLGESWHNGHHAFPSSARHGLLSGQLDLSYVFLRLLERVGLARDLKLPSAEAVERRRVF
jgi:stearoyl-CoA desaturase (delta-9 desaturase)